VHIPLVPALTPLYLYVSTFQSMRAVLNMAVFCRSLTSLLLLLLLLFKQLSPVYLRAESTALGPTTEAAQIYKIYIGNV
jgi:hypothetical protein